MESTTHGHIHIVHACFLDKSILSSGLTRASIRTSNNLLEFPKHVRFIEACTLFFLYAGMAWGIARCEIAVVYGTCDSLHNNSGNIIIPMKTSFLLKLFLVG